MFLSNKYYPQERLSLMHNPFKDIFNYSLYNCSSVYKNKHETNSSFLKRFKTMKKNPTEAQYNISNSKLQLE